MTDASKEIFYLATATAAALLGAREDVKSRRIPNLLTGCSLLIGLGLHLSLGGLTGLGDAVLSGMGAGILLLLMYMARGMGAGDVKLMTAVGCLAGSSSLRLILIGTFLGGALFGIALAVYHRRVRHVFGKALLLLGHGPEAADHDWPLDEMTMSTETTMGIETIIDTNAVINLDIKKSQNATTATDLNERLSIPYAVPIAAGCMLALGAQMWKG